ncbi:hypothetical protein ACFQ1X_15955 [Metaplanococcus flavidus]|uniref:Uncharacterized protein n=2 Tax=Metaplanococcus flavidus TaxID=569883 RepID=A0ABW3LE88_9BACL
MYKEVVSNIPHPDEAIMQVVPNKAVDSILMKNFSFKVAQFLVTQVVQFSVAVYK